jgi:hypothetical protein
MANGDRQTANKLARGLDSGNNNIGKRTRPAAAWLTYSSILQIGRDYANGCQGCAEWVRMAKVDFSRQPPWMKTARLADVCSGCQTSKNWLASVP